MPEQKPKKRGFIRRGRQPMMHFKILASLLYGDLPFIERHESGAMTVPVGLFVDALKTSQPQLLMHLKRLQEVGIAERLAWHKSFFIIKLKCPIGFLTSPGSAQDGVVDVQMIARHEQWPES